MEERIKRKLEFHRTDFTGIFGKPFKHFYCPILHVDEEAALQKGHVINEAFKGSAKTWVVQRQDVDSFFGRFFEADFEIYQYMNHQTFYKIFSDKKLYSHFKPKLLFCGDAIRFFPYRGGNVPNGYRVLDIPNDDATGPPFSLAVEMDEVQVLLSGRKVWQYKTDIDIRISALVSLIKAAHLSLFSVLGYGYACSSSGQFVGWEILGKFFRQNAHLEKREVLNNAQEYFYEFRHMVRPLHGEVPELPGTLLNGRLELCGDSSGSPWGILVDVKTGPELGHSVLLPFPMHDEMVSYYKFLQSERTSVYLMEAYIDVQNGELRIIPERTLRDWPKSEDSYP